MSYDVPPALIQHKRDHLAADATLRDLSARLPRAIDIATGAAELSDEDRQAWDDAWRRAQTAAVNIQLDPWWLTVDDRRKARAALMEAVQG
ncbi:hypothetical protein BJF79_30760 [Actinomadura sp. CNU-125]|uniref:hypothetical protein n=1 Tax=Actinomadura sp. CNU-125 TaxID=1904961 RepID=UPI00095AD523|nr:hypothetical protein [Actinomadura sp. CNU-125]OLT36754.1 hypothetical protein BJF79_30760 [Actinomadura sp. CNU-125]